MPNSNTHSTPPHVASQPSAIAFTDSNGVVVHASQDDPPEVMWDAFMRFREMHEWYTYFRELWHRPLPR